MEIMKISFREFFFALLFLVCVNINAQTYNVSPGGNSLDDAKAWVGANAPGMTQDLIVNLANGSYIIDQPFELNQNHSGKNGYKVIWKADGGDARIAGGVAVGGWTIYDASKNIYKATVVSSLETRQLWVNGQRRQRARTSLNPSGFSHQSSFGFNAPTTGFYGGMGSWNNISDIELIDYTEWQFHRGSVKSISNNQISLEDDFWNNSKLTNHPMKNIKWIENAYEVLNEQGEWYLDRSGSVDGSGNRTIYYKPLDGENMSLVNVRVATIEKLLALRGGGINLATHIENIEFRNITFEYGGWLFPNSSYGFVNQQAHIMKFSSTGIPSQTEEFDGIPGNVSVVHANNIVFEGCTFRHMGATGLEMRVDIQNSKISNNSVYDCSGPGIALGAGYFPAFSKFPSEVNKVKDNRIDNNLVRDVALEYESSTGIFVGFAKNTVLDHNTVYNLPYSGISVGWAWGSTTQYYTENYEISWNRIYNVNRLLQDGGGIYHASNENTPGGGRIHHNYIFDYGNSAKHAALYLDGNSHDFVVDENIIANGNYWIWLQNFGNQIAEDNLVKDNANKATGGIRATPDASNTFSNNTTVSGNWSSSQQYVVDNVGVGGSSSPPNGMNSLIDNPGFELSNFSGWTTVGTTAVTANNQMSGNFAAHVGTSSSNGSISQTITGLTPNTEYQINVAAKVNAGKLFVKVRNYGAGEVASSTTSGSYETLILFFTTGASNTSAEILGWDSNSVAGSHGFFDDFSITESNQTFPNPNKWYTLESKADGRYLANNTETNDALVWSANPTTSRQFRFVASAISGYYNIISREDGRFLGNQTQTANAVFWPATDTDFRRWTVQPSAIPEYYNLVSKIDGLYLGNKTQTNDAVLWPSTDTDFRRWKFVEIEDIIGTNLQINVVGFESNSTNEWEKVKIYPNPFYDNLNLTVPSSYGMPIAIEIIDSTGRIIERIETGQVDKKIIAFTPKEISPGLYYFKVSSGNRVETIKVIKR